ENTAVDDGAAVVDFREAPQDLAGEVGGPVVLIGAAGRPLGRQLEPTAVDEDSFGGSTERDLVAAAEQAWVYEVGAGEGGRALGVVEEAAEPAARGVPESLELRATENRPAPLVVRMGTEGGRRLRDAAGTGSVTRDAGSGRV